MASRKKLRPYFTPDISPAPTPTAGGVTPKNRFPYSSLAIYITESGQIGPPTSSSPVALPTYPITKTDTTSVIKNLPVTQPTVPPTDPETVFKNTLRDDIDTIHFFVPVLYLILFPAVLNLEVLMKSL